MKIHNNLSLEADSNLALSWELLALFTLITKHATQELRNTIVVALEKADKDRSHLRDKQSQWNSEQVTIDDAQDGITDFFQLLEHLLQKVPSRKRHWKRSINTAITASPSICS